MRLTVDRLYTDKKNKMILRVSLTWAFVAKMGSSFDLQLFSQILFSFYPYPFSSPAIQEIFLIRSYIEGMK